MLSKLTININELGILSYDNSRGHFFILSKNATPSRVYSCREEFSYYFSKSTRLIGFSMPTQINVLRFDKFLNHIESRLKLTKKSIIYKTNDISIILIRPAPFWLSSEANRSWLTLFIRCGIVYYKNSFTQAYKKYSLTNSIRPVINHFLKGYTKLKVDVNEYGIVDTFAPYDDNHDRFILDDNWRELMAKPSVKNR